MAAPGKYPLRVVEAGCQPAQEQRFKRGWEVVGREGRREKVTDKVLSRRRKCKGAAFREPQTFHWQWFRRVLEFRWLGGPQMHEVPLELQPMEDPVIPGQFPHSRQRDRVGHRVGA